MDIVGYVALGVVAVGLLSGIGLIVGSIPDINRYRRVQRM